MKKLLLLFIFITNFACNQTPTVNSSQSMPKNTAHIRKEKTEAYLKEKQIKINPHLPYIETEKETTLRIPKEIAQRVTILAMVNLVAFDNFTGKQAIEYLTNYNLWDKVTPEEKAFLENPTPEQKNEESWKAEAIWTLLWALKKVPDLEFPEKLCDLNKVAIDDYPFQGLDKDPNVFINSITQSRSKTEILDANDLYYRIDWACVDARINNRSIIGVNPGVVYERHYALNWLINYMNQEWDEISCDT
ncbi:DUF4272 domain-containing protein [Rhodocytophaga aerolata]|uniref:DUF4272 domain-containing protein n=1 Tax=Rhodocytophaga aerolata TaxID=455078 RepID=A0ABT8RHV0_9BACT|nr:DUF4272 domain-containing protein [Rhodocytophaga aerolata]MDO1451682.1 DUF4272 domain-containing protein [Rhodocytophaga aerolata]